MRTAIVAFVVAAWVAAACTPLVRVLARRCGVVDRSDSYRKLDARAVPLLGGAAIFIAFLAPIAALVLFYHNNVTALVLEHSGEMVALVAGGAIALGLGIVDDAMRLAARWKLLLQVVAASVAVAGGFSITAVSNPFGAPIVLGWLSVPVTIFWFLGCMNALNLLDGLDGLAAGAALFVALTLLLVSVAFGNGLAMLLLACLGGAVAGFLLYNFHPASIFLGDSGSMLLGFLVAALSLLAARKAEAAVALLIPFIALGLPVFDTTLAILRRWSHHVPISAADRQHIHHLLMATGLTHKRAVLVLYAACAALGGAALLISAGRGELTLVVIGSLVLIAIVCVRVLGAVRLSELVGRLSQDWALNQRSAEAQMAAERAAHRIRSASSVGAAWSACRDAFCALGLDRAELLILSADLGGPERWSWARVDGRADDARLPGLDSWRVRLSVSRCDRLYGVMELATCLHEGRLLPIASDLAVRLCDQMAARFEQLALEAAAAVPQGLARAE